MKKCKISDYTSSLRLQLQVSLLLFFFSVCRNSAGRRREQRGTTRLHSTLLGLTSLLTSLTFKLIKQFVSLPLCLFVSSVFRLLSQLELFAIKTSELCAGRQECLPTRRTSETSRTRPRTRSRTCRGDMTSPSVLPVCFSTRWD